MWPAENMKARMERGYSMQQRIKAYFETHKQEFLEDIMEFIKIPSVNGSALPDMPFGKENAEVLKLAAEKAESFGLTAEVLDNHVAVIDLNEKSTELDILAHLDVVPVGDDWTVTAPFLPVIKNGKLYGRGSSDDKGPAIAALYAIRAVKDLELPVNKNVRLILGADEETACRDTDYYYSRFKEAPCSFSPDAEYPLINIEKGGLYTRYEAQWEENKFLPRIEYFKGGAAGNVVPGKAEALIKGLDGEIIKTVCREAQKDLAVKIQIAEGEQEDEWKILAIGKSTHASTPWEGSSAVTGLMSILTKLPMAESKGYSILCGLSALFPHGKYYGEAVGIAQEDTVSGRLTLGTHMVDFDLTGLAGKIDCRAPVCASKETVLDVLSGKLRGLGIELEPNSKMTPPHHVPEERPFIQTLLSCYEQVMGEPGYCMAVGGGTYAHHLENGVAFGCMKLGVDYHMHGADEYLIVDEIVKSAELFTLAIANICK